ncbi:ParB/RepB/Spo0J family partition protein [Candidatus Methylocalor cossyra]
MAKEKGGRTVFFDRIIDQARAAPQGSHRRPGHLSEQASSLAQIASGEIMSKTLLWVDPARCKIWDRHNRRYELLDERRCADLIEGFKAQGRQEFPAIVRKLEGDPAHDYEVVCGARRHWTVSWLRAHNYPQFKFLIEVRQLTDEEAFRLSDIENRDRLDISDYERALDYKSALELYYKQQKRMAERLEVSEGYLSKYLDLAAMPEPLLACYADITHIRVHHWTAIKPLLKSPGQREAVLRKAAEIAAEQRAAAARGDPPIDGARIVRLLKDAASPSTQRNARILGEYRAAATGHRLMTVARDGRKGFVFRLTLDAGASMEEMVATFHTALREYCGLKEESDTADPSRDNSAFEQ